MAEDSLSFGMLLLWTFLLLIPGLASEPVQVYHTRDNGELIEGDILIPKSSLHRGKRQVTTIYSKWTDNTIVYTFDENFSDLKKNLVKKSMDYISSETCIKFRQDNNAQGNYVKFVSRKGCSSYVGMVKGEQEIDITDICEHIGLIVHEIMHALGVWHTQQRYDRDEYVSFVSRDPTNNHNYIKETRQSSFNPVPYEYGSVMHYGPNDGKGSIYMVPVAKNREFTYTMGSHRVSFYDMKMLNIHYGCGCKRNLLCLNGGYTHPTKCNTCICPSGYGGLLCNQSPSGAVELLASSNWQSWTSIFETKRDETGDFFKTQTIIIHGQPGRIIEVNVMRMDGFWEVYGCILNGVEFKTMRDQVIVNPVACSKSTVGTYYRGAMERMPILFYNRVYDRVITFAFRYRTM